MARREDLCPVYKEKKDAHVATALRMLLPKVTSLQSVSSSSLAADFGCLLAFNPRRPFRGDLFRGRMRFPRRILTDSPRNDTECWRCRNRWKEPVAVVTFFRLIRTIPAERLRAMLLPCVIPVPALRPTTDSGQ